jgi:hypothetical protein
MRRPLFPRKQTWIGPARAGKLGEFQRFSPGGLFGLNSDFLRMNQDHRSATPSRQRFDHPHPVVGRRTSEGLNFEVELPAMEMGEWHTAAPVKLRDVPRTCIATILVLVGFDGFSSIARPSQLFAAPTPKR